MDNTIKNATGYLINEVIGNGKETGVVAFNNGACTIMMSANNHLITILTRMTAGEFYSILQSITDKLHIQGATIGDIRFINGASITNCQGIEITYVE